MMKLNEMARNKMVAKCQNLEKILSHNGSYDLNGIELYEELNTLPNAKFVFDIMQFLRNN